MPGIYRRENGHPNKWVNLVDKGDCWLKRRENALDGKWQFANVYRRAGGSWNQIYPRVNVPVSNATLNCGSNVGYTNSGKWTFDGTARQGKYSSYGAYSGFCDISGSWFQGSGSIFQLDAASFSGTRNGSGYYNNNQNVYFCRSEHYPPGDNSSPHGYTGVFTSTTGAPGSGGRMTQRGLTDWSTGGRANCMDWMNAASGKPWLHIGNTSSTSDYMGMSSIQFHASFWFSGSKMLFASPRNVFMSMSNVKVDLQEGDPYHSMIIYPGEESMSLEEIELRRDALGLAPIQPSDTITDIEAESNNHFLPSNGDYHVKDGHFYIKLFNMYDNRAAYYSYDNETFEPMSMAMNESKYTCPHVNNAKKIYIRVMDYKTEEVLYNEVKEIDIIEIPTMYSQLSDYIPEEVLRKYNK